jgi:hypothetical protein
VESDRGAEYLELGGHHDISDGISAFFAAWFPRRRSAALLQIMKIRPVSARGRIIVL